MLQQSKSKKRKSEDKVDSVFDFHEEDKPELSRVRSSKKSKSTGSKKKTETEPSFESESNKEEVKPATNPETSIEDVPDKKELSKVF